MSRAGLVLHTPGHSPYTDTLMMYALAHALGDNLEAVEGRGGSYVLHAEGLTEEDLALRIKARFDIIKGEFGGRLARLVDEDDVAAAGDTLARTSELASYLRSLSQPGHSQSEGRLGRGKLLKLPLMPYAGKYYRVDLTKEVKYRTKDYSVCPYCFAIALIGLGVGTVSVALRSLVVVATIGFEGEISGGVARRLLEDFERLRGTEDEALKRVKADEVPDRVLSGIFTTRLDDMLVVDMSGSSASWRSFVVRFDTARAVQVRGYSSFELDALLSSLAELVQLEKASAIEAEKTGEQPLRCGGALKGALSKLLQAGAVSALEKLFDYLTAWRLGTLYDFFREAYSASEGRLLAGRDLSQCLASLSLGA
jgi:hypothetical protein